MYQIKYRKTVSNVETQDVTWKTHNSGENHDSPQAVKYTIWERYTITQKNAEATTSRLLPRHTRRRLHSGGNDLSLSRSVHLTLQLCNNYIKLCPKSYLYIYDFSAYLHLCPSNRSVPIKAGSVISIYDFVLPIDRYRSRPVLYIFHPVPSEGTCFPTQHKIFIIGMQLLIQSNSSSLFSKWKIDWGSKIYQAEIQLSLFEMCSFYQV